MKVILIQPRTISAALDYRFRGEHIGLSSLVAVLRELGHDAIQYDDALDKRELEDTIRKIRAFQPGLIGITVPAQQATGTTIRYVAEIKRYIPNIPIAIGGIFATVAYKEFMDRYDAIDFLMRGEGEGTIVELANAIETKCGYGKIRSLSYRMPTGEVIHNAKHHIIRDISKLPMIDRSTIGPLLEENRRVGIFAGRGCYGDCTFCSLHAFWDERCVRKRKPDQVVNEIMCLHEMGANKLRFIDDIFLDRSIESLEWFGEFERLLLNENVNLNLWMQFRAQDVDTELMKRLKRLGLKKVLIGVESGDQASLDKMRKHTTVDENRIAFKRATEAGISEVALGFIMFHPDTTLESIHNNLVFLKEANSIRYKNLFSRAYAYAGTFMNYYICSEGLAKETANWYDVPTYFFRSAEVQLLWDSVQELKRSFSTFLWFESSLDIEERFIKGAKINNQEVVQLHRWGNEYRKHLSDALIDRFFEIFDCVDKHIAPYQAIFSIPEELQLELRHLEELLFNIQLQLKLTKGYHLPESEKTDLLEL